MEAPEMASEAAHLFHGPKTHKASEEAHNMAHKGEGMSTGKTVALTVGASTAANVAGYQLNRHINKKTGDAPPVLDGATGGTPSATAATANNVIQSSKRRRKRH